MISFFNFAKRKREELLVLDFGQNAVKGLIFEKTEREREIKKFAAENIEKFGVFSARHFELDIIKEAARKTLKDLGISNKIGKIPAIVGGFSDILQAKVIEAPFQRKNGEKKIGRAEEKEIYQNVLEKGEKKLIREFQKKDIRVEILKKKILEKKIAGYSVSSLLGFRGDKLNFKVLFVLSGQDNFKIISRLLKALQLKEAQISHQVEGLINLMPQKAMENRIFVDIGGKITQVFWFKKGLEFINTFPLGGDDFTFSIAKHFGISQSEAENLKQRLLNDRLSSQAKKEMEIIILPVLEKWLKVFAKTFKNKDKGFGAPVQKISFLGGGSLIPQIKEIVKREGFEIKELKPSDLPCKNKTGIIFSIREIPTILLTLTR